MPSFVASVASNRMHFFVLLPNHENKIRKENTYLFKQRVRENEKLQIVYLGKIKPETTNYSLAEEMPKVQILKMILILFSLNANSAFNQR